jgi:hypothetical protein
MYRFVEFAILLQITEIHEDECRGAIAERREHLQEAESEGAGAIGHALGNERDDDRKDSTHANSRQQAINQEVPHAGGDRAQSCEQRIDQDGY